MATSNIFVLLVCVLAVNQVLGAKQTTFSLPGFPAAWTGSVTMVTGNTTLQRNVALDVKNQREFVQYDSVTSSLSLYQKNVTYSVTNYSSMQYVSCSYFATPGTVNASVVFPTVTSFVADGLATLDGQLCDRSIGTLCIQLTGVPFNPQKVNPPYVCTNYTYYALSTTHTPIQLELADPSRRSSILAVVRYHVENTSPANATFEPLPRSVCTPGKLCNSTCPPPAIRTLFGIEFCNAALIPTWLLAVAIGLGGAHAVLTKVAKGVVGRISYSISFGTYAFMISSGFVVHCVYLLECGKVPADPNSYKIWLNIDAGLTSCIAMSFFWNGLVDLRVLSETKPVTYFLMLASYLTIFYLYIYTHTSPFYLYTLLILVTCGSWCLIQVFVLVKRGKYDGVQYALIAALAGFIGLELPHILQCQLCALGMTWFLETFWYYASDLSVYLLIFYVLATRDAPAPAPSVSVSPSAVDKKLQAAQMASLGHPMAF